MTDYKVQVKLEDGTITNFTKFVVNNNNGIVKEFDDQEDAERYLQQIDQDNLKDFMLKHYYYNVNSNDEALTKRFVDWYANLNVFDKSEFLKLLPKVHKLNE